MSELKTITIDGVAHDFNAFTDQQKLFVAQINEKMYPSKATGTPWSN